jgi:hypothetical protein
LLNARSNAYGMNVEVSFDNGQNWILAQEKIDSQVPVNWDWSREYINLTKLAGENQIDNISNVKIRFVCNSVAATKFTAMIDDIAILGSNNPVHIEENDFTQNINIYPNPAKNETTLEFGKSLFNPEIQIVNTLGNEVYSNKLLGEFDNTSLNVENFKNGLYFVRISAEGKKYQTKLNVVK